VSTATEVAAFELACGIDGACEQELARLELRVFSRGDDSAEDLGEEQGIRRSSRDGSSHSV
jgi:hypothetical protein